MTASITIDGRAIGSGHPPYVIAELSCNHNGSLDRALEILEQAKASGADALKLQTYTADTLTIDHDAPAFKIEGGLWDGFTLHDLYKQAQMPWEWHEPLFERGRQIGLTVFSSPFDWTAVDYLEGLDAPAYKIASFEAVDLPLIEKAASTGKPVVISTGMANLKEIEEALRAAQRGGADGILLLHCVSDYPTPAAEANLRTIPDLADRFGVPVGLSDHTLGTAVAIAGVALGAAAIEKHFTLSRADGGFDAAFSLEPAELAQLTAGVRTAWEALGQEGYDLKASEDYSASLRRSLYVVEDIDADGQITTQNVRSIRPAGGLAPKYLPDVLGRRAARRLTKGTPLSWSVIKETSEETA